MRIPAIRPLTTLPIITRHYHDSHHVNKRIFRFPFCESLCVPAMLLEQSPLMDTALVGLRSSCESLSLFDPYRYLTFNNNFPFTHHHRDSRMVTKQKLPWSPLCEGLCVLAMPVDLSPLRETALISLRSLCESLSLFDPDQPSYLGYTGHHASPYRYSTLRNRPLLCDGCGNLE